MTIKFSLIWGLVSKPLFYDYLCARIKDSLGLQNIENETEVSFFNYEAYKKFKENPEVSVPLL